MGGTVKHTLDIAGLFVSWLGLFDLDARATALGFPGLRADRCRPANGFRRSIKQFNHRLALAQASVRKSQQGNAETQLVQTSQESSLQNTDRTDVVLLLKLAVDFIGDTGEFQSTQTTQVVDKQDKVVLGTVLEEGPVRVLLVEDLLKHGVDQLRKSCPNAVRARLVVDTHANFNFIVGDGVLGHGTTRNVNVLKRRTNRGKVVISQVSQFVDLLQRTTLHTKLAKLLLLFGNTGVFMMTYPASAKALTSFRTRIPPAIPRRPTLPPFFLPTPTSSLAAKNSA